MRPPERKDELVAMAAWFFMMFAIVSFSVLEHRRREASDELRIERDRRHELERTVREKDEQINGALETIARLNNGDTGE